MTRLRLLLPILILAGCPIGNEKYPKPRDLSQVWDIDRLRVLAVKAEPPEVQPGETATFKALVVHPYDLTPAVVWLACPPDADDPGGTGFGCTLDPSFDFTTATPEELEEAGFIGFEPLIQPRYTAPADLLSDLDERAAAEGVYVLVQVTAIPASVLEAGIDGTAFDFGQVEAAFKRLVVSTALTPNHNPEISNMTVDGLGIPTGTIVEVDAGESYEIGAALADGAIETYQYLNPDGVYEDRTEEPYIRWYSDAGTVTEQATLYPYLESTWTAPTPAEGHRDEGTIWAVLRDRRGGMSWASLDWRVRQP